MAEAQFVQEVLQQVRSSSSSSASSSAYSSTATTAMTLAGTIMADCARTMYGIGMAVTVIMNIIFYICFLVFDANTLVDFGWAFNQLLLAALCFGLREVSESGSASATGAYEYLQAGGGAPIRNIVSFILIFLWAARLGGFLFITRVCKGENDARYEAMAKKATGGGDQGAGRRSSDPSQNLIAGTQQQPQQQQQPNSKDVVVAAPSAAASDNEEALSKRRKYFFFQFSLQAIMVVFPATPLYFIFAVADQRSPETQWSFWVGIAIAVIGIINSWISDMQLENFKEEQKEARRLRGGQHGGDGDGQQQQQQQQQDETAKKDKPICRNGWWKNSRHPNLFFEVVTWIGFAILGIDHNLSLISLFGLIGPVLLLLIMKYLTVPITEESMKKSRPNWDELTADTNMFWPF